MIFGEIPGGALVFVDANVFVYALAPDAILGPGCSGLLARIEIGELGGCISASILGEVAHRLMTLEACETFGWPYSGIAQRLRQHPDQVLKLHRFRTALDEIAAIGMTIYPVVGRDLLRAAELSQTHGLLSNDALVVSIMESHGITHLASNDADFDRVPWLARYTPE